MGDHGAKVVKVGYDVATATILQQVFNSSYNCLKIEATGTVSSTASGFRTVNYDPGLSYKPAFLVWFEVNNSGNWFANNDMEHLSGANCTLATYVDSDGVVQFALDSDDSKAIIVNFMLFVDPGE